MSAAVSHQGDWTRRHTRMTTPSITTHKTIRLVELPKAIVASNAKPTLRHNSHRQGNWTKRSSGRLHNHVETGTSSNADAPTHPHKTVQGTRFCWRHLREK